MTTGKPQDRTYSPIPRREVDIDTRYLQVLTSASSPVSLEGYHQLGNGIFLGFQGIFNGTDIPGKHGLILTPDAVNEFFNHLKATARFYSHMEA